MRSVINLRGRLLRLAFLLIFFLKLNRKDQLQFFYQSLLSGVIMILIFIPAINIFIETTKKKYAVFAPVSVDLIKQIFKDFADNSDTLILISIIIITFYFFFVIKNKLFKNKEESLIILILLSWICITLLLPIIRSYLVTPMISSRYFIVILAPLIILVALGIDKISKKIIQIAIIAVLAIVSFIQLIYTNDYYNRISKGQFR